MDLSIKYMYSFGEPLTSVLQDPGEQEIKLQPFADNLHKKINTY